MAASDKTKTIPVSSGAWEQNWQDLPIWIAIFSRIVTCIINAEQGVRHDTRSWRWLSTVFYVCSKNWYFWCTRSWRKILSDLTPTQVHVQSRLSLREKKAKVMQTSKRWFCLFQKLTTKWAASRWWNVSAHLRAGGGFKCTSSMNWTGLPDLLDKKQCVKRKKEPVRRINRNDVHEKQLELAADKSLRREKVKSCMFPCRSHQVSINSSSRGKKQTDRWDVCQCVAVRIKYVFVRVVCVCTFEVV